MQSAQDLYAYLGLKRTATPEDIRVTFRQTARRFHPDVNPDPQAHEEFKLLAQAYETLSDPLRRAQYDASFPADYRPLFSTVTVSSRGKLLRLPQPQIIYVLADISTQRLPTGPQPPLNLCLVIDRSTSMQGARLDQIKAAARQIVESLNESDIFSIVTFSDRAEVVLPAQPCANKPSIINKIGAIGAGGGTEILQGLLCGLLEIQRNISLRSVSHLILLTDGRTYGDEDDCLLLAMLAESDGITISGLGIGDEWNDAFMDTLTASTGGKSQYVASPAVVARLLSKQVRGLGDTLAKHVRLRTICDSGVKLKSAFRVAPDAQALAADNQPMSVGNLARQETISILFEFVVTATADEERPLARVWVIGDLLNRSQAKERLSIDLRLAQTDTPDNTPPHPNIVAALDKLTLYRLQEKAWADVEEGNIPRATQRLQTLASRLIATGQRELANIAINEATRLSQTRQLSAENRKRIKYGTRALIPPPKSTP
ncbi:MAG: VWA domain-containing protein [Chloroflexi bacterium]|nr:VWA domain-containing protein [Chloroflexota bacterium]